MRAISMKCSQENWEEIKPILEQNKVRVFQTRSFYGCPYIVTNFKDTLVTVSNVLSMDKDSYGRQVYEEWDKGIFLDACGITEFIVDKWYKAISIIGNEFYIKFKSRTGSNRINGETIDEGSYKQNDFWSNEDFIQQALSSGPLEDLTQIQIHLPDGHVDKISKLFSIEDLREGECALINDGTLEELNAVLKAAFPEDTHEIKSYNNDYKYYYYSFDGKWGRDNATSLPKQSVKDFKMNKFKAGDKVRIINRKPTNCTGNSPKCYEPQGNVGQVCYVCEVSGGFELRENADRTGKYFGVYSTEDYHFNDDDLEFADFVLPEKWCLKITEENKETLIRWRDFNIDYSTYISNSPFYHSKGPRPGYCHLDRPGESFVEITYNQFLTHVLKQETNMVQKLTLGQLKDLYNESSCNDWRNRIKAYINDNLLSKDDSLITIKDEDISYARQNANASQLDLLKSAGIKFEEKPKYKHGDWVTFTKDCSWFNVGDVKQLDGKSYGYLCIDNVVVDGAVDLTEYFRPATEEEIIKAKCPYKDGDLLFVKDGDSCWNLRYSNGTLDSAGRAVCYDDQRKSGYCTTSWGTHKLANIELPND